MANYGKFSMTIKDYDKESSDFRLTIPVVDNTTWVAINTKLATLRLAIEGIELGNTVGDRRSWFDPKLDPTPPTDKNADRERKWLVRYHDSVTFDRLRCEIPCADRSLLTGNSDIINAADFTGAVDTFRTAFEDVIVNPATGNAVVVDSIESVGKRL